MLLLLLLLLLWWCVVALVAVPHALVVPVVVGGLAVGSLLALL